MTSQRIVKALEKLALAKELGSHSNFREIDPTELRKRSCTDQLFLQMPWLGSRLTRDELSMIIHWCFMIRDQEVKSECQRILDHTDIEVERRFNFDNFRKKHVTDVELTLKKEKKLKLLVDKVANGQRKMKLVQSKVDKLRKAKGLKVVDRRKSIIRKSSSTVGRIPIKRGG